MVPVSAYRSWTAVRVAAACAGSAHSVVVRSGWLSWIGWWTRSPASSTRCEPLVTSTMVCPGVCPGAGTSLGWAVRGRWLRRAGRPGAGRPGWVGSSRSPLVGVEVGQGGQAVDGEVDGGQDDGDAEDDQQDGAGTAHGCSLSKRW